MSAKIVAVMIPLISYFRIGIAIRTTMSWNWIQSWNRLKSGINYKGGIDCRRMDNVEGSVVSHNIPQIL